MTKIGWFLYNTASNLVQILPKISAGKIGFTCPLITSIYLVLSCYVQSTYSYQFTHDVDLTSNTNANVNITVGLTNSHRPNSQSYLPHIISTFPHIKTPIPAKDNRPSFHACLPPNQEFDLSLDVLDSWRESDAAVLIVSLIFDFKTSSAILGFCSEDMNFAQRSKQGQPYNTLVSRPILRLNRTLHAKDSA